MLVKNKKIKINWFNQAYLDYFNLKDLSYNKSNNFIGNFPKTGNLI